MSSKFQKTTTLLAMLAMVSLYIRMDTDGSDNNNMVIYLTVIIAIK